MHVPGGLLKKPAAQNGTSPIKPTPDFRRSETAGRRQALNDPAHMRVAVTAA
jgi:hypothetical protein